MVHGNHLGSMFCHLVPRRSGVVLVGFLYVLCGLFGCGYLALMYVRSAAKAASHKPTCFNGGCSELTYEVMTCEHTAGVTLLANQVLYVCGGLIFGFLAIRGVGDRFPPDLYAFSTFSILMAFVSAVSLAADIVFSQLCGRAPGMWLTFVEIIVPSKFELLGRLGYHPEHTSLRDLELVMGFDVQSVMITACIIAIGIHFYFAYHTIVLAQLCRDGPAMLGPAYGVTISADSVREWQHMVHDLVEAAKDSDIHGQFDSNPISNLRVADHWVPVADRNSSVHYHMVSDRMAGTEVEPLLVNEHLNHYGSTEHGDHYGSLMK